ncbi:hypothetical protein L1987_49592 [Smallanthus sonchifolius]|uniref:Uncharacterized protein n=1 Tax=Smallanthus sonchifolius TaxID=185202 RepID=A0ACB9FV55_9ASTR|nr:hypothetical protein L1987_49592 [Smallanthus sonchifolius]
MEIFMAEAHSNPKFINQIMGQYEKEQELNKSLPFMMPTLKLLSKKHNLSFVYNLFEMVNDPDTNSIVIWSKSGTSFFVKDSKGLQDHVQERFNHTIRAFYKKLGEFTPPFTLHQPKKKEEVERFDRSIYWSIEGEVMDFHIWTDDLPDETT